MSLDTLLATMRATAILLGGALVLALALGTAFGTLIPWLRLRVAAGAPSPRSDASTKSQRILGAAFFSFVGLITGILAGNSRTAVVGDVLPAILTMIGGLAPLLLSRRDESRGFALLAGSSLAVATLVGAIFGAHFRDAGRNSEAAMARRAQLAALCKVEELRSQRFAKLLTGQAQVDLDFKCSEYPRD